MTGPDSVDARETVWIPLYSLKARASADSVLAGLFIKLAADAPAKPNHALRARAIPYSVNIMDGTYGWANPKAVQIRQPLV